MQVCPAGTRASCHLVQLKGLSEGLRLLAWSNVINPFSSHVSGREGVLREERGCRCELSLLGRNETVKERETTCRVGRDQCNARSTGAEDRTGTNRVMLCGSSRDDKFHPEFTIVVCDMMSDDGGAKGFYAIEDGWVGCVSVDSTPTCQRLRREFKPSKVVCQDASHCRRPALRTSHPATLVLACLRTHATRRYGTEHSLPTQLMIL